MISNVDVRTQAGVPRLEIPLSEIDIVDGDIVETQATLEAPFARVPCLCLLYTSRCV